MRHRGGTVRSADPRRNYRTSLSSNLTRFLLSVVADVRRGDNDSGGGKERDSICSHVSILWLYYPIASTSPRLLTCHVYTCAQAVHIQISVRDTQPSITSLESFRSRCAPIHTLSHCFDFSKYKDVNQLPPLVRGGEFIHAGSRAHLCMF